MTRAGPSICRPPGAARPRAGRSIKLLFFREKDLADLRRLVAAQRDALDTRWVRAQIAGMMREDDERVTTWDQVVAAHGR